MRTTRICGMVVGIGVAVMLVGAPASLAKQTDTAGTLTVSGQQQTSDILAWSWGLSNSGSTHTGGGGGAGKANVQDVSVTKLMDANSIAIVRGVATGQHFQSVTLAFPTAPGLSPFAVQLELEDVLITSYSTGGSGNDVGAMTENVTFNFAKFEFSIGTDSFGFDIPDNQTT
jgi:type VI secretion system secreted protein Hcp